MKSIEMFNGEELSIGDELRFADIWQSDGGDEEELLESGCIWVANDEKDAPLIVDFEIVDYDEEKPVQTIVRITDIR